MSRIVVGVDGSKGAQLALAWAVDEAKLRGATLRLVYAWHAPYISGYPLAPQVTDPQIFEDSAREVLQDAVASIDATGLNGPVEKKLVHGGAATVLLVEADDADLVVVGARGLGGFAGLLLGSVSAQVAQHAPCPVVVVPEQR